MFCVGTTVLALADLSNSQPACPSCIYFQPRGKSMEQTSTHSLNSGRRSPTDALAGATNSAMIITTDNSINCIPHPPLLLPILLTPPLLDSIFAKANSRCFPVFALPSSPPPLLHPPFLFLPIIIDISPAAGTGIVEESRVAQQRRGGETRTTATAMRAWPENDDR